MFYPENPFEAFLKNLLAPPPLCPTRTFAPESFYKFREISKKSKIAPLLDYSKEGWSPTLKEFTLQIM